MCARFTLTTADLAALARQWAAELDEAVAAAWRPRFNVAPGQPHPVLVQARGTRRLALATFGLPARGGALHLNARVETAAEKRAFRDAWLARRAAVPVDGFFEWDGPARARRPHWLHRADRAPFLLAGLWQPGAAGAPPTFAIVTADARGVVRRLHDRMPVLLPEPLVSAWLAGGPAPALPGPPEDLLVDREVSPRVNATAHDDPECLAPPQAAAQLRLL
jgi:putative SOS response-associated peptidase YedK